MTSMIHSSIQTEGGGAGKLHLRGIYSEGGGTIALSTCVHCKDLGYSGVVHFKNAVAVLQLLGHVPHACQVGD